MSAVSSYRSMAGSSVAWSALRRGTGRTTARWQDKRGSPVVIQAIEMACLSACLSVGARAAPADLSNYLRGLSGTTRLVARLARRS